jgi:uncharacterized membrane protein YeaQ/YmgE (transglycosylase-associated protein family)
MVDRRLELRTEESKMNILIRIVAGIIAGWLTGLFMEGKGFGLLGDLVVGLAGGLLGGWLARLVSLPVQGWIGQILVSIVGGIILVAVVRAIRGK